jgi:hypothetical protein
VVVIAGVTLWQLVIQEIPSGANRGFVQMSLATFNCFGLNVLSGFKFTSLTCTPNTVNPNPAVITIEPA